MADRLQALTLIRPWPWAIIHAGKPVENRTWAPPASLIGRPIAIHAGKKWDDAAAGDIASAADLSVLPAEAQREGIVAVAIIDRVVRGEWHPGSKDPVLASEWYSGPVGWVLRDVVELREPVPCRGAQGLWPVPEDVIELVRKRYKEARHG